MRIICWNMQKLDLQKVQHQSRGIAALFDKWQADVVIMLEPPDPLYDSRPIKSERGGAVWSILKFPQSKGCDSARFQGRVSVATHTVAVEDVRELHPYDDHYFARQLRVLKFVSHNESILVATCHAPFDEGGPAIVQYRNGSVNCLREWRATEERHIDVWIGDVNTAGTHSPDAEMWTVKCARPTSAKGRASPRDKVFARGGAPAAWLAGRIVSQHGAKDVSELEGDLRTDAWETADDVPSDHVPVYIDTSGVVAPLPAPAPFRAGAPPPPAPAAPAPQRSLAEQFRVAMEQGRRRGVKREKDESDAMDQDGR